MNPIELEQTRIKYVRVINGLPDVFTDRYDGVPVTIMPGKSENLPLDMAGHFFGPDFDDRAAIFKHVCKRQGWNTLEYLKVNDETGKTLAQDKFDKLKIEAVAFKLVPADEPDPREPIPADPEIPSADDEAVPRRRGNKLLREADSSVRA